jgi:hypothetical protein
MNISVFLSYPKPILNRQQEFIDRIIAYMYARGLGPRTLGITDYDTDAPLTAVRRLMLEANGLVTVGFRRTYVEKATVRHGWDIDTERKPTPIDGSWLSSPWPHIEAAMAYQLGLPILIFREKGVLEEGVFEKGIVGLYMPQFDLDRPLDNYFSATEWQNIMGKWEGYVRAVVDAKGRPPRYF